MPRETRQITHADILSMEDYGVIRAKRQHVTLARRRRRRVSVGPFATFAFESFESMLTQVHEMLFIEGGGSEQIASELAAYNPLVPQGSELVATLMLEIDDVAQRAMELGRLGGIEHTVSLRVGGELVAARADAEVERSTASGRTSAVHFLHFPMSGAQVTAFRDRAQEVVLGVGHTHYKHVTVLSAEAREELATDLN